MKKRVDLYKMIALNKKPVNKPELQNDFDLDHRSSIKRWWNKHHIEVFLFIMFILGMVCMFLILLTLK